MDGDRLGHFSLLEKIGEGGMGRVYKARDTRLERLVAIKLLPESRLTDPDRRARFFQEARAASALNHPNIITIYEIREHEGQSFIVMELVEGQPLTDLIPAKGMRLTDALRIGAQVADALSAAHAAGIVHRDLKPANIMVDRNGRVKVLDFGLAKLSPAAPAVAEDATQTVASALPRTEQGVLVGSIPYMSPEQAEGKPVDARSDIFSFGAVLYEMITGRRAFHGESRASTLAAIVEKEPVSASSISETVPPELERLLARCLRKDVARRSQHMADVKLALEELRDESESGKLTRPPAVKAAARPKWLWPAIAASAIAMAAVTALSIAGNRRTPEITGRDFIRVSPDDAQTYFGGSLSPDGKFMAYLSDRSGKPEVWLQQIAGGDPIQLTHEKGDVVGTQFFPDGSRLIYSVLVHNEPNFIASIPTLGGQPRLLVSSQWGALVYDLSHDGRRLMYFDEGGPNQGARMMILDLDGGKARELTAWRKIQNSIGAPRQGIFTSDDRYLLCTGNAATAGGPDGEWFAIPVDGGDPKATGAGAALRAAGLKVAAPALMTGDRVLFASGKTDRTNIWEIRLSTDSMRVRGQPRQLTFGIENHRPTSVAAGMFAFNATISATDFYLIPLSPDSGQPAGPLRRLTRDGRRKLLTGMGGNPGEAYFTVLEAGGEQRNDYTLDLQTFAQRPLVRGFNTGSVSTVSPDGREVAFSVPDGDRYSVRLGEAGDSPAQSRPVCQGCGLATRFSADGRYLMVLPDVRLKPNPMQKVTAHLVEVATGKDRPWLEHPTDSIVAAAPFGADWHWAIVALQAPGSHNVRAMIVPWRPEPVPVSEWIEAKGSPMSARYATRGNYFLFFAGDKLMAIRFDPKTRSVSDPYEVKLPPDSLKPSDQMLIRGPGVVFARPQLTSSVWMTKLPE